MQSANLYIITSNSNKKRETRLNLSTQVINTVVLSMSRSYSHNNSVDITTTTNKASINSNSFLSCNFSFLINLPRDLLKIKVNNLFIKYLFFYSTFPILFDGIFFLYLFYHKNQVFIYSFLYF